MTKFPHLDAWAKGESAPTLKQLERFAHATHTPVGYFFLPEPPEEEMPIPDFRTIQGRAVRRPSPNLLETVYVCQERQEWYRDFARSMRADELGFVSELSVKDEVVHAAKKISDTLGFDLKGRGHMGTWTDALQHFIDQADAAGIMIVCSGVVLNNNTRRLDPDEFRGFAMTDNLAPLVFINGADTKSAQMFTLAHALAPVWLGQSALSDVDVAKTSHHEVERWCNHVAAELLVPLTAFEREFKPKEELRKELNRLARFFKVSTLVILRRAHDAGVISKQRLNEEYAAEMQRLCSIPRGSGGNFYLTQAARVSKRFVRALVSSTQEG